MVLEILSRIVNILLKISFMFKTSIKQKERYNMFNGVKRKRASHNYMVFYKFLASYIIVLIIPLLIISLLIYGSIVNTMVMYIKNENVNKLKQIRDYFDERIGEIKTICAYLPSYTAFQRHSLLNNTVSNKMGIIEVLNNYNVNNNFIYEIFFYERGQDYLYSSSGVYKLNDFTNRFYSYRNLTHENFVNYISKIQHFTMRGEEWIKVFDNYEQRFLSFFAPVPDYTTEPYGVVMVLVHSKVYEKFFRTLLDYPEVSLVILDKGNRPILLSDENAYNIVLKNWKIDFDDKNMASTVVNHENESFVVSYVRSDLVGWKYFLLIPKWVIENRIKDIKNRFFYSLMAILLISAFIIYFLMRLNYSPIKKLSQFINEKFQKNLESTNKMNELEYLQHAITELLLESNYISEAMTGLKGTLKEVLLQNTLKGEIGNIEEFNKIGSNADVVFNNTFFAVAVISFQENFKESGVTEEERALVQVIEKNLPAGLEGYGFFDQTSRRIVMILALDLKDEFRLKKLIEETVQSVEEKRGIMLKCGIGTICHNVVDVQKSYVEACAVMNYDDLFKRDKVVLFKEIIDLEIESDTELYSREELKKLSNDISTGNAEGVLSFSREVINRFNSTCWAFEIYVYECKKLAIFVMQEMEKIYGTFKQHIRKEVFDVSTVYRLQSKNELIEWVKELFYDVVTIIDLCIKEKKLELLRQILEYVDNKCYSQDFSLKSLADHFGLSESYISRYFKNNYGMTVSDYVKQKRMEKAATLLESSNKDLQTIALEVGYVDVSSFIRNFKKEKGITPGEYRNSMRKLI